MKFISHHKWQHSKHFNRWLEKKKQVGNHKKGHLYFTSQNNAQIAVQVSGPRPLPLTMNDNDGLEFLSLKVSPVQVLITRHNKHHTHRNTHVWKALDLPIVETTVPAKKKESLKSQLLSSICDSFPTGYTPFRMASVRFWKGKQSLVSMWLLYSNACCNNITVLANYCSCAGLTEIE